MAFHGIKSDISLQYEYCMVFKLVTDPYNRNQLTSSSATRYIIHRMKECGLDVFLYLSVQNDELIALIRAPVS